MDNDTFTMEDVEAIQLDTEPSDNQPAEAASTAEDNSEKGKGEGEGNSFFEHFQKAKSGEPIQTETPEPELAEAEAGSDKSESRSAKDFRLLKEERDNAKTELEKVKQRIGELENNDVEEVLKQLQTERDELSEQLKITSIERHPDFRRKFDDRLSQVVTSARNTVGEHNADAIERLLKLEDSDLRTDGIEEIFTELSPSKQAKLGAMLAQVDDIRADRQAVLSDAEESYKQLAASGDAQREAHMQASNKLFDGVLVEAQNLEVFQSRDGQDEWNDEVQARVSQARNIFTGDSDAQELARASLWAAAGPKYRELLGMQVELNQRLQAQIKGEGAANPTVSGASGDAKTEPKSFTEMFGEITGMDVTS